MTTRNLLRFQSIQLRELTLANSIVISPMRQRAAEGARATAWRLVYLGKFALDGAGLILAERTAVDSRGRIGSADLGLWNDSLIDPLKGVVCFVPVNGGTIDAQLAHAAAWPAASRCGKAAQHWVKRAWSAATNHGKGSARAHCRWGRGGVRRWRWTTMASRRSFRTLWMPFKGPSGLAKRVPSFVRASAQAAPTLLSQQLTRSERYERQNGLDPEEIRLVVRAV